MGYHIVCEAPYNYGYHTIVGFYIDFSCVSLQIVVSLFVAVILDNLELDEDIKKLKQVLICVEQCLEDSYLSNVSVFCCICNDFFAVKNERTSCRNSAKLTFEAQNF